MADPTVAFFEELGRRGHEPLLQKTSGTVRVDVVDGRRTERWFVRLSNGDVAVSRRNETADCVLRGDRALFDDLVRGKANAVASMLRGALELEGDLELLVAFQRLFPGPRRGQRMGRTGFVRTKS